MWLVSFPAYRFFSNFIAFIFCVQINKDGRAKTINMHYEINTQLSTVHQEYFQCSVSCEEDVYRLLCEKNINWKSKQGLFKCNALGHIRFMCVQSTRCACCQTSPEESDNVVPNNQKWCSWDSYTWEYADISTVKTIMAKSLLEQPILLIMAAPLPNSVQFN